MFVDLCQSSAILLLIAVGHLGVWIAAYNRINATGFNRIAIKRIEILIVLTCAWIPFALIGMELYRLGSDGLLKSLFPTDWSQWSLCTQVYCCLVILGAIVMTPDWIMDRPFFATAGKRFEVTQRHIVNHPSENATTLEDYIVNPSFRKMARLPKNEVASLERNIKRLALADLPADLEGLRIAHLSDIHLTGKMATSYYRLVMDWVMAEKPDLIVVAGDIVDYAHALPMIDSVFEQMEAPMGKYFVIGNHDRRLETPTLVCERMESLAWVDLGRMDMVITQGSTKIRLIGNERPWFHRNANAERLRLQSSDSSREWRLGVSHSPDQIRWGYQQACKLLLCGHTHGGQIRFPVIGPVISPSWYGSRYASGVFERQCTLMHVSRGVSGVHPFRWGCLPEVTILELSRQ